MSLDGQASSCSTTCVPFGCFGLGLGSVMFSAQDSEVAVVVGSAGRAVGDVVDLVAWCSAYLAGVPVSGADAGCCCRADTAVSVGLA